MFLILLLGTALVQALPSAMSSDDDPATHAEKDRAQVAYAMTVCTGHIVGKKEDGSNQYEKGYADCYYVDRRSRELNGQ